METADGLQPPTGAPLRPPTTKYLVVMVVCISGAVLAMLIALGAITGRAYISVRPTEAPVELEQFRYSTNETHVSCPSPVSWLAGNRYSICATWDLVGLAVGVVFFAVVVALALTARWAHRKRRAQRT